MSDNSLNQKAWCRKSWVQILAVIVLFAGISLAYFTPAVFEGRKLFQADGAGAAGAGRDVVLYQQQTGHRSLWTGNMFGGMPTYQISPSYPSTSVIKGTQKVYSLQWPINILGGDSYLVFMMLAGFYIFMRAWGYKRLLALGGAIMWAFSSYFLILIDAGHIWKLLALCYIPPTIGGLVLAFKRKKYLLGFVVTALFTALQIYSNHIQMSYYFAFVMLAMVIAWGIEAYRAKSWKPYLTALGTVLLAGLLGVSMNATNLYHTYKYSKETMRGGSEIKIDAEKGTVNENGLDREYITQWSYGIDETLTLLIPDSKGGFSSAIGMDEKALQNSKHPQGRQFVAQQNRYWGDQPFTSGPVYVGAFVLALAILGIFIWKGPMKWSLLAVTLISILLSWGHNLMWFTDLFIDYMPLYDKFRTVSSILVIVEMTIPIFAIKALAMIIHDPTIIKKQLTYVIISVALTAGVALLMWVAPSLNGSFLSQIERSGFAPYIMQQPELGLLVDDLEAVRKAIFQADALRSFIFVALGCAIIALFYYKKINATVTTTLVLLLCFVDLWSVDKRYLNDSKYLPQNLVAQRTYVKTPIDDAILADTTNYRVMNMSVNTFNDATTSLNHRSVGGYHAAKLQRYDDLIHQYLSQRNLNVLRALNTKYYIVTDSLRQLDVVRDDEGYGNAWFVDEVMKVKDADSEFKSLNDVPLDKVAVIAPPYDSKVSGELAYPDSTATIDLVAYAPDKITYRSSNSNASLAVFSEIFYPDGWHATIDGEPAEILRADYILRALNVPAGDHTIEFKFEPQSVKNTEWIAYISQGIVLLAVLFMIYTYFIWCRKKQQVVTE